MKQQPEYSWTVVYILSIVIGFVLGLMAKVFFYGLGIDLPTFWMGVIGAAGYLLYIIINRRKEEE